MKEANSVFAARGTTIFTVMSALAEEHGAINLGQGFPDGEGPEDLRAAAARYLMSGPNQYPPSGGVTALRQAIAAHDRRFYGLALDWQRETLVTSGGTEALTATIMALVNPGDDVVLIEPVYDCYRPIIEAMGGRVRAVRLKPPEWTLSKDELATAFTPNTKFLVLNSPMNPIGKVFTEAELDIIAGLVRDSDAYVVCDEVYEHLVFSGHKHVPLMTLPGMAERCVKIGSAGKTFSLTGWKVGYVSARERLLSVVAKAHQYITFTTPPALQFAVAEGLAKDDAYYRDLADSLDARREYLREGLERVGFKILPCGGTYFLTADFSALRFNGDDQAFCEHITKHARVAAVPLSPFYGDPATAPRHLVRFCFCKEKSLLEEAIERLRTLNPEAT